MPLHWRSAPLPEMTGPGVSCLPFGNGRSYGDSCLNEGGVLLDTRALDRWISVDFKTGILRCEAGMLLDEILERIVPRGWFLPVVPGTRFITLGGAIANDVHGKNHPSAGSFGCHIRCFELLRSDGRRLVCSPTEHADWFYATIGGMGLTGLILWAEIALRRIRTTAMHVECVRFWHLDEAFELAAGAIDSFEYNTAWLDGTANGDNRGRGIFTSGNHGPAGLAAPPPPGRKISVVLQPPVTLLTPLSVRVFNRLRHRRLSSDHWRGIRHFSDFLFPLDAVHRWNRLYGPRGFLQYQCVLPHTAGVQAVREILDCVARRRVDSALTVLKFFGRRDSGGWLSFPRRGVTLSLDFSNRGETVLQLLDLLDGIVLCAGGAVSPYKDARMRPSSFKQYFPLWARLEARRDPVFSSSFWRRVTGE